MPQGNGRESGAWLRWGIGIAVTVTWGLGAYILAAQEKRLVDAETIARANELHLASRSGRFELVAKNEARIDAIQDSIRIIDEQQRSTKRDVKWILKKMDASYPNARDVMPPSIEPSRLPSREGVAHEEE